ncbi:MAG: hypothetical protein NTV31_13640 [Bacteroidia bacterium]|nr:hypothetical protein [Bacteroidia bacterium]
MKRISLIIIAVFSLFTGINAQNVEDALRYSQLFYGGTARFMSMGGAFTALGGDMSSLSQNPAGIGVFRSSELTVTPQLFHINSTAGFNGNTSDYLYNFNLNQAGIVSNIISNESETGLITLNVGYSFNKTNNLNQNIRIEGESTSSSMADYWARFSEGKHFSDLSGVEGIAYDAWIIDTLIGTGGRSYSTVFSNYGDNPPSVYGQTIERHISYEGYTGEHAISIGGNYSNKIFFGVTLGINKLKYTSHFEHLESTDIALASKFENFTYVDHYENSGTGYSLKMGAIIKPIEIVRIGLAFHAPTKYRISEYFYEDITSNFTDGDHYEISNEPMRYSYALTTPFRALAGVSVQIKKIGLLSADYEFVDYSTAKFSETGDGYDYTEKNVIIKDVLKSTSNIRLGGELRLNKLYLRTGYGYYGKAIRPGQDNENLDYSSISFGAGFREQNISIDFAYTNYRYSQTNVLYPLDNSPDPATVDYNLSTVKNMFTVSLGYKFGY